jgi:hypothetical protein
MDFTNYLADKLIKATVGDETFTAPAKPYLALFTEDPTKEGNSVGEVAQASYNRQEVTMTDPVEGVSTNANQVDWSIATSNWGHVGWIAIMDAPSSGSMLYFTELGSVKNILTGDQFIIKVNELKLTLT